MGLLLRGGARTSSIGPQHEGAAGEVGSERSMGADTPKGS